MSRLTLAIVFSLTACFGQIVFTAGTASADITNTQATISCNDGHSVVLGVDQATLTALLADIQAINASGTGLSCSLATSASSQASSWTVYDYNPSGQAIAPRDAPKKMPASTPDSGVTWTFPFKPDIYTALFTTTDRTLTGDLSGVTLTDTISVSGDAASFKTQHGGGDCNLDVPAAVRFYFTAPSASRSTIGTPPAGFYTAFWWSNPVHLDLTSGNQNGTIFALVSDPNEWSDWNGKRPTDDPSVFAAFTKATQNVQSIGLSFGGHCFFETGVTPTPDTFSTETFSSEFSETV